MVHITYEYVKENLEIALSKCDELSKPKLKSLVETVDLIAEKTKTPAHFQESINAQCKIDTLLYSIVYFTRGTESKVEIIEYYHILLCELLDRTILPNNELPIDNFIDRLAVGGWRGCGKSTLGRIFVTKCVYFGLKKTIGIVADKEPTAVINLVSILDMFSELGDDGEMSMLHKMTVGLNRSKVEIESIDTTGNHQKVIRSMKSGYELSNGCLLIPLGSLISVRGKNFKGRRLDLAFIDDARNEETRDADIEKARKVVRAIFDADTRKKNNPIVSILFGNYEWDNDMFHDLVEESFKRKRTKNIIFPLIKTDLKTSNTIALTDEEAQERYRENPRNALQRPDADSESVFDFSAIEFITPQELRKIPTYRVRFVDPAFSKKIYSCDTGIADFDIDEQGRVYVQTKGIKLDHTEIVKELAASVVNDNIDEIYIEGDDGAQAMVSVHVIERLRNIGHGRVPVFPLKISRRPGDKLIRIKEIVKFINKKNIVFVEGETDGLLKQMRLVQKNMDLTKFEKMEKTNKVDEIDAFSRGVFEIMTKRKDYYITKVTRSNRSGEERIGYTRWG